MNDRPSHNPDSETGGGNTPGGESPSENERIDRSASTHAATIPPFTPDRFLRDLGIDSAIRWAALVVVVIAAGYLILTEQTDTPLGLAVVLALAFGWISINTISATIWRTLPSITEMIGPDPASAEALLAEQLKRRPLVRWVRLMLYHRLASIRHRQQRFHESAVICQSLLGQSLGPARRQRGPLLLMLLEAQLYCGNLHGAYAALLELHRQPLSLVESLQRLALQTRYEVLAGHDGAALAGVKQKLMLAELMSADHCGAMHAMLTTSATRAGHGELADWLWRRTNLLCSPAQIRHLFSGPFAIGVVTPPDPND